MERLLDLEHFKYHLPYSSEIFGIYQPLLGWKGERNKSRVSKGTARDHNGMFDYMVGETQGVYTVKFLPQNHVVKIDSIKPGRLNSNQRFGSTLMKTIAEQIPPSDRYNDSVWDQVLDSESIDNVLNNDVKNKALEVYQEEISKEEITDTNNAEKALINVLENESATAGVLFQLKKEKAYEALRSIFYDRVTSTALESMTYLKYADPFERIKLTEEGLSNVVLSPIGIAHLFRQYFYEFDTFLGPAVGHVWVSPGTTVELLEVSTRKNTVERMLEKEVESIAKTEKSITDQDEISEAVKEENRKDTKVGATVTANQNWVTVSATETGSFSLETTQAHAREQTHKHMRQQSEKLSTEIKENMKTTFKVVTETTEVSSKRYVLSNQTSELANYELRRKMRHVGVQVQDIGSYLCWQTYVDDPGKDLGLANLVHIAKPADLHSDPNPTLIPQPQPFQGETISKDYYFSRPDWKGPAGILLYDITPPKPGFIFERAEVKRTSGSDWELGIRTDPPIDDGSGEPSVRSLGVVIEPNAQGNISGEAYGKYDLTIFYKPSKALLAQVETQNKNIKLEAATEEKVRAFKEQYINAARERIKLASKIEPRKYEDLREEERIVVYRKLIQEMLAPKEENIPNPDDKTRHIVAELLNSIFDVDKMLYFVAPEWWRPRLHQSHLSMGSEAASKGDEKVVSTQIDQTSISDENIVGWGGIPERRRDDYYITEDSVPAKFGSSLGWLLQLDGDNMRNAFLNSPWVKAVIPIRPGKEKAALNWLKEVEGKNGIGEKDLYNGPDEEFKGKKLIEVLEILAQKVHDKHEASKEVGSFPRGVPDPKSTVSATPIDAVYEHGFYPLEGGFRAKVRYPFEVFDQWVEVVPTDQIAAVEVKYDPKTGRQI